MPTSRNPYCLYGKKANTFLDIITVVLIVIASGIVALVAVTISTQIHADIQADSDMDAEAKAISQKVTAGLPTWLDNGFLFMIVLLWVFLLVSTVFIDAHPAFFGVMVVLMLFAFLVIMVLSNVYFDIANEADFLAAQAQLPIMYWINTNLLVVFIIIGGSTLVALYAKQRYGGM